MAREYLGVLFFLLIVRYSLMETIEEIAEKETRKIHLQIAVPGDQLELVKQIWQIIQIVQFSPSRRLNQIKPIMLKLYRLQTANGQTSELNEEKAWSGARKGYEKLIKANDEFVKRFQELRAPEEVKELEYAIQDLSYDPALNGAEFSKFKSRVEEILNKYPKKIVDQWVKIKNNIADDSKPENGGQSDSVHFHDSPRCPDGFTFVHKSCYTKLKGVDKYINAVRRCKKMHESAHLPIIKDKEENDIIVSKYGALMWVGITRANGNKFIDEKGREQKFFNWDSPNEPNNYNGIEDCVEMKWKYGQWNDVDCNLQQTKVVCQVDPIISRKSGRSSGAKSSQIEREETSHCPMGFELISGSCYSKIETRVGHDEAEAACTKLYKSSHLAVFKNEEENDMISKRFNHYFWLGLTRKAPRSDKFVLPSGREATFLNFRPGEPNNANGKEDCVEIYGVNGKYNDIHCDRETFPLCQTEPVICPRGFEFFHNSCYKKIHEFMNQPDAVKACKSIHNSSHLPVFNDDAENYAVTEKFGDAFWLGIARENATSEIFVDENGNVAKYFRWDKNMNEPNNFNGQEACAEVFEHPISHERGLMNDVNCLGKESFPLCQVDPIPVSKYEA